MVVTRVVSPGDAGTLARLLSANRDYLAPWSPLQDDAYYTADGQRQVLTRQLAAYDRGAMLPLVILDSDGAVAGSINLNSIVRGAFQSASVGYWVSQWRTGRAWPPRRSRTWRNWRSANSGCTGSTRRRCCTTRPRSGCCCVTASGRSRWPSRTSRSPGAGRITSCSRCCCPPGGRPLPPDDRAAGYLRHARTD